MDFHESYHNKKEKWKNNYYNNTQLYKFIIKISYIYNRKQIKQLKSNNFRYSKAWKESNLKIILKKLKKQVKIKKQKSNNFRHIKINITTNKIFNHLMIFQTF